MDTAVRVAFSTLLLAETPQGRPFRILLILLKVIWFLSIIGVGIILVRWLMHKPR